MTRVQGRAPGSDPHGPYVPRGRAARLDHAGADRSRGKPLGRRAFRQSLVQGPAGRGETGVRRRALPPVLAFALVMLGLSALAGVVGGVGLMGTETVAAIGLLIFAVAAAVSAWWLAHGRRRGYWSAVVILGLVGVVPMIVALSADADQLAVVLAPPLVVAGLMLVPRVRATLISDGA